MKSSVSDEITLKHQNPTYEITHESESIHSSRFDSIASFKNQTCHADNHTHNTTIHMSKKGNPNHFPNLSKILESRYEKTLHQPRPSLRDKESIEGRRRDKDIVQS